MAEETAPETLLRAGRAVVDGAERSVSVRLRDGVVVAVGAYDADADGAEVVVLADDEVLLPGLVDTHVHVNEPGRTDWEGFASATRAAAAGGVTTIVDMPLNSIPPTTTVAALEAKRAVAADQAWVDVGFWGGAVPGNVADLAPLHDAGVFGFKCFLLDSGVEEFPHLAPAELADAMAEVARIGSLMVVHAEDADEVTECAHGAAYRGFLDSRPDAAEERAIALVIDTARRTGARAHVVHLSASGAVPALRAARAGGVDVSVETCPHYLHFEAATIADGATELKCCPPIRDAANRDALWQALARRATSTSSSRTTRRAPLTSSARRQATSPMPGVGSPRSSWACPSCGRAPASAACPSPRWCAGWPPPRPAGWGWPARARSPWVPTRTSASSRPTRSGSSTRRRCTTRTRSRPTPGVRSPAPCARPGCAGDLSTCRAHRAADC